MKVWVAELLFFGLVVALMHQGFHLWGDPGLVYTVGIVLFVMVSHMRARVKEQDR